MNINPSSLGTQVACFSLQTRENHNTVAYQVHESTMAFSLVKLLYNLQLI